MNFVSEIPVRAISGVVGLYAVQEYAARGGNTIGTEAQVGQFRLHGDSPKEYGTEAQQRPAELGAEAAEQHAQLDVQADRARRPRESRAAGGRSHSIEYSGDYFFLP